MLLGRADAVLTQDTSFAYQAKQHPGQDRDRLHVRARATRSGSTTARPTQRRSAQQIKDGVARLKANGTLAKLATKYKIPVTDVQSK